MADKRISQLIERTDIANNDVLPIVASGATTTNKVTISTIQNWMQDNLDVGVTSVGITLGSSGTDVNVSGSPITTSGNITINIPDASASARGLVTTGSQVFGGVKTFANGLSLPAVGGSNQTTRIVNIGTLHEGTASLNQIGFNSGNNIYFGKGLNNGGVISWNNAAVRYYTLPDSDGTIALTSNLSGYVTLDTAQTITGSKTFNSRIIGQDATLTGSGSPDTLEVFHTSGSGIAVDISKAGNGEGLRVAKTSGSGNAVTITGGLLSAEAGLFSGDLQSNTRVAASTGGQSIILTANSGGTTNRIETTGVLPMALVSGGNITLAAGGTTPQITLASTGAVTLSNLAGTGTRMVVADSNGVLSSLSNPVTGTLDTGQVAFGTAANTIGGDNGLFWDNTNKRLGIGTIVPSSIVDINSITPTLTLRDSRTSGTWSSGIELGKLDFFTSDITGIGAHSIASINVVAGGQNTASPDGNLVFSTGAYNTVASERWRITSTGILQSNGAQTIQTSTGNLTLATAGGNGNIILSPNGTGVVSTLNNVGIGTATPTFTSGSGLEIERSDANSTIRLQRIGTSPSSMEIRSGANTGEISVTSNSPLLFFTNGTERWSILSTGILQSNGAQTIQTSTGNLTLATAAGNGNIILSPNGTGGVGINTNTPLGTLDIRVAGNGGSASNASNSIIISPLSISDITEGEIGSQIILNARRNGVSDGVSIAAVMQSANFDLASMAFYTHSNISGSPRIECMRIFGATGNLLLQNGGTFTDAGFRLDVNGTARVQGAATFSSSLSAISGQFNPYTTAGSNASPVFQDALIIGTSTNACKIQYGNEFTSTNGSYLRFVVNGGASQNNPVNAMTINPSGNIGIGTTSPAVRLQVQDSANTYVSHFSGLNQTNGIALGTNGSNVAIIQGYTRTFSATNNIAMQVDGGNVGIGTSSPQSTGNFTHLDVVGKDTTSGGAVWVSNSDKSTRGIFYNINNLVYSGTVTNHDYLLITNDTERMRITSGGDVLIGQTSVPGAFGNQKGLTLRQAGAVLAVSDDDISGLFSRRNSNGDVVLFRRDTTTVGSISVTTTATSYNTSSDYRLKENVKPVENALSILTQLKPCTFNFITESEEEVMGFLAHEVQEVMPQAVKGEKDAVKIEQVEVSPAELDEEGNVITEAVIEEKEVPVYQGIDHSKLVPLLVAAIQEQQEQIKSLTEQVEALKSQING